MQAVAARRPVFLDARRLDESQDGEDDEGPNEEADDEEESGDSRDYDANNAEDSTSATTIVETLLGFGEDVANYHLRFSTCTNASISNDDDNYDDNDDADGDSHQSYLHYHTCLSAGGGYVTQFWDECTTACTEEDYCNGVCLQRCQAYYNVTLGTMDYNGCVGPISIRKDGNSGSYYYGPMCSSNGGVTMSFFTDDSCTTAAEVDDEHSYFKTFDFVDSVCSTCSMEGVCESIYDAAVHCYEDTLSAVAVGESTSLQPGEDENSEDGDDDDGQMEFANQICYDTATDKQRKNQHSAGSTDSTNPTLLWLKSLGKHVLNGIMAIAAVGLVWFAFISIANFVRFSSNVGGTGAAESLYGESYITSKGDYA